MKKITNIKYLITSLSLALFMLFSINAFSASKKKKSKKISAACLTCLNSFSPETLTFTRTPNKCTRIVTGCTSTDYTNNCEKVINECFQYNCQNPGECSDEQANKSLLFGCLKAENKFMPFQCASYIAGKASSYAKSQTQAQEMERIKAESESKKAEADAEIAKAEAAKAQSDAEIKQKQLEEETKQRKAELEAQNAIALKEKEYELQRKEKEQERKRQKEEEKEIKNSKPNVKYANLIKDVKKSISNARNTISHAFNLLGLTKTNEIQKQGNIMFFPPQIISTYPIYINSNNPKVERLLKASKYQNSPNFVCTRDTTETAIRNDINSIYNTLNQSKERITTGISEIEANNEDEEAQQTVPEDKIETLSNIQDLLTEAITKIDTKRAELKTSCSTRCAGFSSMNIDNSSPELKFDEKGNIIKSEDKKDPNEYSCKEFDEPKTADGTMDFSSLLNNKTSLNESLGGIGAKVMKLTRRVSEAVITTDMELEKLDIEVQLSKTKSSSFASGNYIASNCVVYLRDPKNYANCMQNLLNSQLQKLMATPNNTNLKNQVNKSVKDVIANLQTNYYDKIHNDKIYCPTENAIKGYQPVDIPDINQLNNCIVSINQILNKFKDENLTNGSNTGIYISGISGNRLISNGMVLTAQEVISKLITVNTPKGCNLTVEYDTTINYGQQTKTASLEKSYITCNCSTNSAITISSINSGNTNICK